MTYTRIYHIATKLPGGDGAIKLTKPKGDVFAAKETVRLIPGTTYDYALASEVADAIANPPPVIVPPVVSPPMTDAAIAIKLNESGAVTHFKALDTGVEYVQIGAPISGAMVGYNGSKIVRQASMMSPLNLAKGMLDGLHWTGGNADVLIDQTITIGERTHFAVTITNRSVKTLTAPRYMFWGDFAPNEFKDAKSLVEARRITMDRVILTSDDPAAVFFIADRIDPRSPFVSLPAATKPSPLKAHQTSIGVGRVFPDLAPWQPVSFAFDIGLNAQ